MKILLCFFALVTAAFAATPVVTVDDNLNAVVDGSNFGKAGDVIVNHKGNAELVSAVNVALAARLERIKGDAAAAVRAAQDAAAATVAAKEAEKVAAIAEANTAKTAAEQSRGAAVVARQTAETAKATETARVAAIVTALRGVSPTLLPANVRAELQTAREKERAALIAAKEKAEADLAALP